MYAKKDVYSQLSIDIRNRINFDDADDDEKKNNNLNNLFPKHAFNTTKNKNNLILKNISAQSSPVQSPRDNYDNYSNYSVDNNFYSNNSSFKSSYAKNSNKNNNKSFNKSFVKSREKMRNYLLNLQMLSLIPLQAHSISHENIFDYDLPSGFIFNNANFLRCFIIVKNPFIFLVLRIIIIIIKNISFNCHKN
jgi:hypothetical protein